MPHMHLRGKAFRYEVTYPDGKKEVLLDVPRYDFGWQTSYQLAEPKLMPKGTRMDCIAKFDNSDENLNNPDPKVPVRFGDQTFEEMMIGFFEQTPAHEDLLDPSKSIKPASRLEEFNVLMAATKGEPDDNIKVGAYMALSDPKIFAQYGFILRTMVPQVDRLDLTVVKDGKISELMGPSSRMQPSAFDKDGKQPDKANDEAEKAIAELKKAAAEKHGLKGLPESIFSPLPTVDAKGESLADYAQGHEVVVNNDLSKAKGKLVEAMIRRGAKSSLHVPVEIKGQRCTLNFWSTDEGAFTPPAAAVLTTVAKIMTAPKDQNAQAAAAK